MGRKGQVAQMRHSLLVKDTQKRHGHRKNVDSFAHTSDIQDGTSYNRINFQSVTEQSNLEDFLTKAEMAGREFAAERQNFAIITDPGQGIKLTTDDVKKISSAQQQHKELLRIPRRPHWDEFTSKEELLLLERDTFTEWRKQLNELEEKEHIELTPYEKNLDFWRQLWRVIERSDVVVQIVDARNPLLFRCEDLELYIRQVGQDKTPVLLVNKADYLNHQQRVQWVEYFNKQGIQAVFFSAKQEAEKHVDSSKDNSEQDKSEKNEDTDEYTDEDDSEDEMGEIAEESENELNTDNAASPSLIERLSPSHNIDDSTNKPDSNQITEHNVDLKSLSINDNTSETCGPNSNNCDNQKALDSPVERAVSNSDTSKDQSPNLSASCDEYSGSTLILENSPKIVNADELLDILKKLSHPSVIARSGDVRTIGMVGYPNVGKSSTINVILKQKRLAVSVTPGRTKHLQTLYVDDSLMLCDCPGLVFPSFVTTKAHLVINGVLPIDELKDHVSPITLVCEHIPRNVLEATYGIMIPRPSIDEDQDRPLRADELLNAYGSMRGFMTQRGIPDGPRASRYLLKDYVKGKLLFCNPPPGISPPEFQDKTRIIKLEAARPVSKVPLPQIKSQVDKEFFQKRLSNVHSSGVRGVKGYVRVDCLKQTSSMKDEDGNSVDGSMAGSSMSLNSVGVCGKKPWKQNKHKKKEKLRKVHRDLDIH